MAVTVDPLPKDALQRAMRDWQLCAPELIAKTPIGEIYRVTQHSGDPAVLKCLGLLGQKAERDAPKALAHWKGAGAVTLLNARNDALLLEYCEGPLLIDAPEAQGDANALSILCAVAQRLHQHAPPNEPFATIDQRCEVFDRITAPDSKVQTLFDEARASCSQLSQHGAELRLLHGDLHHCNVMRTSRDGSIEWCAIDPQPVFGDRAYDFANLFGNPHNDPDRVLDPPRPARLATQIAQLTNIPKHRLISWAFVHSCISTAWHIENGTDPSLRLTLAQRLVALT